MAMSFRTVKLAIGVSVHSLVVRPRPGGGPDQALVFTDDGDFQELVPGGDGAYSKLGPKLGSTDCGTPLGCTPAYEPASDAVFFASSAPGYAIASRINQLAASNRVRAVAGPGVPSSADGASKNVFLGFISGFAADGRGAVWLGGSSSLRRLDVRSGKIDTWAGPKPPTDNVWSNLAFEPAASTLLAASHTAVCRVRTEGESSGVELVAGDWTDKGSADGSGAAARFQEIRALLPVSGGRLLIADGPDLRCMDAGGAVSTLLRGCFSESVGRVQQMALLPNGDLGVVTNQTFALISGGDLAPAQPRPCSQDRLLSLLAPSAAEGPGCSDGGGGAAAASAVVTVRMGDRAFPVQRSVLAAGSEYFARLLATGGGFAESAAAEVALPDADPAAFAFLLSYMYGMTLGHPCLPSQLLAVPLELLRPTAALAGRLLMGGALVVLKERLAAAATPASVLSDLAWADAHGMTDLAERLRAYAVRKRRYLEPGSVEELVDASPQQAAKLLKAALQA